MGAFTKHPYMEQNFETSWLNIFWGLFHLFVLDRLIGDAWRRGRLLGIVGSGQWGGRDKKKEKALKDGWENINISMDEQKNHTSSFNIFDKIRHNLCLFWKTGWAQRDQNYWADHPIGHLTLKKANYCQQPRYLHGVVGEYGVEMVGLSGSRWFLHIVSRARAHNIRPVFPRRAYVGVVSWRFAPPISFPCTHNFPDILWV